MRPHALDDAAQYGVAFLKMMDGLSHFPYRFTINPRLKANKTRRKARYCDFLMAIPITSYLPPRNNLSIPTNARAG